MRTANGPPKPGKSRFSIRPIGLPLTSSASAKRSMAWRILSAVKCVLRAGMPPAANISKILFACRSSGMIKSNVWTRSALRSAFLRPLPQCADQAADRCNRAEVRRSDADFRYHEVKLRLDREYQVDHVHGRETGVTKVILGSDGT